MSETDELQRIIDRLQNSGSGSLEGALASSGGLNAFEVPAMLLVLAKRQFETEKALCDMANALTLALQGIMNLEKPLKDGLKTSSDESAT